MIMGFINRRKWIYSVIGVFILVVLVTKALVPLLTNSSPESQGAFKKRLSQIQNVILQEEFLDPQRNLPEKAKLYDFNINCEQSDYKETPFIKRLRDNETVIIPEISVLETLTREELAALYHMYIETVQLLCKRVVRLGQLRDGGWDVCHDAAYRPRAPCLVYSFGINNDFSFDDAVIKEYGCMVHSFDPSMSTDSYKRGALNMFHNVGLSSEDVITADGWQINRLKTIQKDLGHIRDKISILKMDIELWEWTVLPDILDTGILSNVDALFVEFHLNLIAPPTESGSDTYLRALIILKRLYDLDFRIFNTHRNPSLIFNSKCRNIERANCHELNFQKVKRKK